MSETKITIWHFVLDQKPDGHFVCFGEHFSFFLLNDKLSMGAKRAKNLPSTISGMVSQTPDSFWPI